MKKVMLIYGTRPEAIKMAPIITELKKSQNIQTKICLTGQHREMVDYIHQNFAIQADYDLSVMQPNQTLSQVTEAVLQKLNPILETEKPDLILVQGDTTTAFVAGLCAFYHKIKVAHVEAGLRSFNNYSPYPEEMNRKLLSQIAEWHFAPTEASAQNLLNENVAKNQMTITGNTAIDSLYIVKEKFKDSRFKNEVIQKIQDSGYKLTNKKIVLITNHRRENLGQPMQEVFQAIRQLSLKYQDHDFIFPVHMNPKVQDLAQNILANLTNVHLIRPLDYFSFTFLMIQAQLIITDSGGIQEEATGLSTPILITRQETERPEVLTTGRAFLVGVDAKIILEKATEILDHPEKLPFQEVWPFGQGDASKKIVQKIQSLIQQEKI